MISTVIIDHEIPLDPPKPLGPTGVRLLRRNAGPKPAGPAATPDAGPSIKVPIRSDKWRLRPIGLDEAATCRPIVGAPEARVEPHRLRFGERDPEPLKVLEFPDRGSVDGDDDFGGVPEDRVGVEVFGWVEPEAELLLALAFALGVDVCVEGVGVAG